MALDPEKCHYVLIEEKSLYSVKITVYGTQFKSNSNEILLGEMTDASVTFGTDIKSLSVGRQAKQ